MKLASSEDYILRISAGPSYDDLKLVHVNHEESPILVNSPHFTGYILVRVSNFDGVTPEMELKNGDKIGSTHNPKKRPTWRYFKGRNRRYSMVIQGRFKHAYNGDEVVFGADSNAPISSIPGSSIGIRICKWLDPALEAEVSGNDPHIYSPIVSSMNAMGIFKMEEPIEEGTPLEVDEEDDTKGRQVYPPLEKSVVSSTDLSVETISIGNSPPVDVKPWSFAKVNVPERNDLLFDDPNDAKAATNYEKRKKLFGSLQKRLATHINPEYLYCMDFYDAYFDLSTFTVKLPGFSVSAFKYWDGEQPLRYVCKTRDGSTVFFVIQFDLIPRSTYPGLPASASS